MKELRHINRFHINTNNLIVWSIIVGVAIAIIGITYYLIEYKPMHDLDSANTELAETLDRIERNQAERYSKLILTITELCNYQVLLECGNITSYHFYTCKRQVRDKCFIEQGINPRTMMPFTK